MASSGLIGLSLLESNTQPKTDTGNSLAICAAKIVDGDDSPSLLATAFEGIRKGIKDLNMRRLWIAQKTIGTPVALVDGQTNYAVPSGYFVPATNGVQLVDATTEEFERTLVQKSWLDFQSYYQETNEYEGIPRVWYSHSTFSQASIEIYPKPTAEEVSKYKLRITYYERIPEPTQNEGIEFWEEVENALCLYGQWWVLRMTDKTDAFNINRTWEYYEDSVRKLKRLDGRQDPDNRQFKMRISKRGTGTNLGRRRYHGRRWW